MEPSTDTETVVLEDACQRYVGQWNRLISTTNWEKGRIIQAWRMTLIEAVAAPSEYSDEAWSRRIGNVSGQHVGRLRRVYERFGDTRQQYEGLYWSHFQAALDWNDAEMWLEGAVQNQWSVAKMRHMRWEALGGSEPQDTDVVTAETDEDFSPLEDAYEEPLSGASLEMVEPLGAESLQVPGTDESNAPDAADTDGELADSPPADMAHNHPTPAARFEEVDFDAWPDDLAEAFDALKLAIVRHRMSGWNEIAPDEVVAALNGLRQLALAPAEV